MLDIVKQKIVKKIKKYLIKAGIVFTIILVLIAALQTLNPFKHLFGDDSTDGYYGSNTSYNSDTVCIDGLVYDNPDAPVYTEFGDRAKNIRDVVRPYLQEVGLEQYIDIIVAICAQESGCGSSGNDWMQCGHTGESGLPALKAGVDHFKTLLDVYVIPQNCTDIKVLIQSYNMGCTYVKRCMNAGGKDTKQLRIAQRNEYGGGSSGWGDIDYADKAMKRVIGQPPADAGINNCMTSLACEQLRSELVALARAQIGKPYIHGKEGPDSYDCSGLTRYCYKKVAGINLEHKAQKQYNASTKISESEVLPGDLVFFSDTNSTSAITHVGICTGNGMLVDAPGTGRKVQERKIWSKGKVGYGRFISVSEVTRDTVNQDRTKLITLAEKQIGKPYLWGAAGPNKFDCSGLSMYCYRQALGISISHSSQTQYNQSTKIKENEAMPGDLVFFSKKGSTSAINHVGIYIGNGMMIEAPHKNATVRKYSIKQHGNCVGYGRYIKNQTVGVTSSVPYYAMGDTRWKGLPWKGPHSNTVALSGCGPVSMAMVLSYWTGKTLTPDKVVDWCNKNPYYHATGGMSDAFPKAISNAYGVRCNSISWNDVVSELKKGHVVVTSAKKGAFTNYGHIIVLTGITSSGKIKVNDPNKSNYTHADLKDGFANGFSPDFIKKNTKKWWSTYK